MSYPSPIFRNPPRLIANIYLSYVSSTEGNEAKKYKPTFVRWKLVVHLKVYGLISQNGDLN